MTEFLGTDGGQIAYKVTGLTAAADEVVAVRPELVWDLVVDVTRVGEWSPECVRAAWLSEPGRPQPGARFTGHNRRRRGQCPPLLGASPGARSRSASQMHPPPAVLRAGIAGRQTVKHGPELPLEHDQLGHLRVDLADPPGQVPMQARAQH